MPPTFVGFELEENALGNGGVAIVYKAKQIETDTFVAIKTIRPDKRDILEVLCERLRREAQALEELKGNSNILKVVRADLDAETPFIALEYCEFGSLRQRLQGSPIPPNDAARLLAKTARALEYCHQKKLFHRDLKPSNILFSAGADDASSNQARGELSFTYEFPKVADFGLVRSEGEHTLTLASERIGTPSYMAPEQTLGRDKGPLTDVYGLGAILYECLTGQAPFLGDSPEEIFEKIQKEPLRPPRSLNASVPRDLEAICLTCLSRDPEDRYESAGDLANDLDRFVASKPIRLRQIGKWNRSFRWAKHHPGAVGLIVATILLLALVCSNWRSFTPESDPWPPGEAKEIQLADGWEAQLFRDAATAVHLNNRVVGKLKSVSLSHAKLGKFVSNGPSVDLDFAGSDTSLKGWIEGDFISQELHESLTRKVPSLTIELNGRILFGEEGMRLMPSGFTARAKRKELELHVADSIREYHLPDTIISDQVRATRLKVKPTHPKFEFADRLIVMHSGLELNADLEFTAPSFPASAGEATSSNFLNCKKHIRCVFGEVKARASLEVLPAASSVNQMVHLEIQVEQYRFQELQIDGITLPHDWINHFKPAPNVLKTKAQFRAFPRSDDPITAVFEKVILATPNFISDGEWIILKGAIVSPVN